MIDSLYFASLTHTHDFHLMPTSLHSPRFVAGRIAGRATEMPDYSPRPNTRIERSVPRDTVRFEFGRAAGSSFPKVRRRVKRRKGDKLCVCLLLSLTCSSTRLISSSFCYHTYIQFSIRDGDIPADRPTEGVVARPLRKTDAAILGGMATAVVAQNYRARHGGGGAETDIHLVTYQVALYDTHGLMTSLQRLAQRAETTTSAGLASLASNVCLELLRGQDGWVSAKSSSSRFKDMASAEKEFNEMSVRERKKWAYENSVEDRAALAAYTGPGSARRNDGKNLMVLTLMCACRHVNSKIMPKKQGSVEALETSLEKFAAALLEKGGRNVVAVDVSWTPDDPKDILSRIELHQKWSDLIDF